VVSASSVPQEARRTTKRIAIAAIVKVLALGSGQASKLMWGVVISGVSLFVVHKGDAVIGHV